MWAVTYLNPLSLSLLVWLSIPAKATSSAAASPPLPPVLTSLRPRPLQAPAHSAVNTALPYQRHGAPKGRRRVLLLEEAEGEAETARRRRLQGTTSPPVLRSLRDLTLSRRVKPFPGGCRSTSTRSGASFRRRRMLPTRRSSPKVRQQSNLFFSLVALQF